MILICLLFGTLFGVVSLRLFYVREFYMGLGCLCVSGIMLFGAVYMLVSV